MDWGSYLHGPAIVNVVYALINNYDVLIIPSSFKDDKFLWGSTSLLDNYYSSNLLKVCHGENISRIEKTYFICNFDPRCLNYLRVCWLNPNESYNCSNCEKCLRTMYSIYKVGFWDLQNVFDKNIEPEKYLNLDNGGTAPKIFRKEIEDFINKKNNL